MVLVFVEHAGGEPDELSLQALTLARGYAEAVQAPLHAVLIGAQASAAVGVLGTHGVATVHVAEHDALDAYAPAAWAQCVTQLVAGLTPEAVFGPGSERGQEILAHVAAGADQPLAANCLQVAPGDPAGIVRVRWGGSLLEEARLHGSPKLITVAAHALASQAAAVAAQAALEPFTPSLAPEQLAVRVCEHVDESAGGVSLATAKVVVSGGRGVGSAQGFAPIEELAALLGGAVGCSRAVTSAGWRPHTDQVGQTGTKISPDIYIACGISGATQHMAGCKAAKNLLAINPDGEASIFASADYAVIGDLHEVLPAISAELRRVRGA
jgi:electron transfer flavoprotein alpha subunit